MSRPDATGPTGIVLVDKAPSWTSHDVVAKARGLLGTRKVGHSGTLDPDATGLLILGVGRATRLLTYLTGLEKTYTGEAVLGTATSTLDASGEVVGTWDLSGVGWDEVREAAGRLTGAIEQVPPMVSAKKVDGRRLHELARAGVEVERQAVPVMVQRFDVREAVEPGVFPIAVSCSSGTYIRSLVADLGAAVGGGAHLRNLRRVSIGSFDVADAVPIDDLSPERVLLPAAAFPEQSRILVEADLVTAVSHGRVLSTAELGAPGDPEGGPWPVVDEAGNLLAVYLPHPNRPGFTKPGMVLSQR